MNNKKFSLLYFDVELDGVLLGRIIIEPLPSPRTAEFVSYFQPTSHVIGADALANVAELKPHDFIKFQWNPEWIQHKPSNSSLYFNAIGINESGNDSSPLFDDTELTSGAVIICNECPQRFCIVTSPWHIMTSDSHRCLVGRIYKGMTVVNHLTNSEADANLRQRCKVVEVGIIAPGHGLGILPPDAILDTYPSSPSDAMDVDFLNIDNVLCVAYGIKTSGSLLFRQGKYEMAMCRFKKSVRYLSYAAEKQAITRDQEVRMLTVIVPCILDSAFCKLKMKDFDGALEDCNEALEISPMNAKIFFRRGQANHGKMNYEQSLYDLYTAQSLSPNDKSIRNEIAAVEGEMQVYKKVNRRRSSSEASMEAH